ncbi:MAG: hypothetical protein WGN25_11625 [Candidatus Electrothrix sp. GW3-4]|uniref:hypothetical protein n=1 Tax=Candidatus Electrothrix sp. GW3-4 TaxID=3126740 RepID=UPI0030D5FDF8
MRSKSNPFPLADLLDAGAITGIVVALLYTAGWSYAYHYFSCFHLNVTELGVTRDTLFVYSLWVLQGNIPALLTCFGTIGLYFFLRSLWKKKTIVDQADTLGEEEGEPVKVIKHPLWLWIVTLVGSPLYLLLLFFIFYYLGSQEGLKDFREQQKNDFSRYPRVKVWLKGEQTLMTEDWAGGCYRMLLRNKDQLYIFLADGVTEKVPTEVIPNSRVEALRVMPMYQSTPECQ